MHRILVLWTLLTLSVQTAAQTNQSNKVVNFAHRPTMENLFEAWVPWPEKAPYALTAGRYSHQTYRLDTVRSNGPEIIAELEAAYPGAIWMPVGRDAVLVGDMLDAFYHSIGQPGRVSRIDFSGNLSPSSEAKMIGLMRQAGVDFTGEAKTPFVLLDVTSYSPRSQMRTLLDAGYAEFQRLGVTDRLAQRFTGVNLSSGDHRVDTLDGVKFLIQSLSEEEPHKPPREILSVDAGTIAHSETWHDTFQSLRRIAPGQYVGIPGQRNSLAVRRSILSQLWKIDQIVSSQPFLEKVKAEAEEIGYRFPMRHQTKPRQLPKSFPTYRTGLQNYFAGLGDPTHHLVDYVYNLLDSSRFNKLQRSILALDAIIATAKRSRDGEAPMEAFYWLISQPYDREFAKHFAKAIHQHDEVRELWMQVLIYGQVLQLNKNSNFRTNVLANFYFDSSPSSEVVSTLKKYIKALKRSGCESGFL